MQISFDEFLNHIDENENIPKEKIILLSRFFPLDLDEDLGKLIGIILSDGHIQKNKLRIDITSRNLPLLKKISSIIENKFGVNSKIRKCTTNKLGKSFNLGINNPSLSLLMVSLGVPRGKKTDIEFMAPHIVNKNTEILRGFISGLFSGDGTIEKISKDRIAISLEQWKRVDLLDNLKEFMNEIRKLIKDTFGIHSFMIMKNRENIRNDMTISKPIKIRISRKSSIFKFYNEIKLLDKEKDEKLEKWLASRLGR